MADDDVPPSNVQSWRTSRSLLIFTATLGLFTETFLYGFVVPILPYMIEIRLGLDPSQTQRFTTAMLFILGLIAVPAAPIIGHFADKTTSRKIPLLISLLGCTVGTVLVAWTPSVLWVYAGRIIQGIAGTGAWIIGFTMLTDAAGPEHLGKALGLAGSFITAGVITGPAISGALFQWFGYWWAWAVPLALLAVDVVARLAMSDISGTSQKSSQVEPQGENEDDPLLQPCTSDGQTAHAIEEPSTEKAQGFYRIMLSQSTVWVGLFSVTAFAIILAGFDATLPVHLRNAFGWNPAAVGAIFLGLQVPGMFLSPFIGGLRDRVGLRWPTTLGWILLTPLLWLSGTPGTSGFPHLPWGSDEGAFIACIISIGLVSVLVRGAGTFQLTSTLHELQAMNPRIFGRGGGSSRIFSLTEIAFNMGLMLGPALCGSLSDAFGFYYMSCALAAVSAFMATISFMFFTHKTPPRKPAVNA